MAKRINELAMLVKNNSVVADIGCDHAYLIVELFKQKKIKYAYAIDNKDGPVKNAINNINKYDLSDKCEVIKADGLSFDISKKVNTLVFAGMGGDNVIEIISKDISKIKNIKYIITDIHKNDKKLYEYLNTINFILDESKDIIDREKKYHLCRYKYGRK